jgi:nitric oxide reductase NorE protein
MTAELVTPTTSPSPDSAIRTRFASGSRTDMPGDFAMWVFVLGDLFIFGSYFLIYIGKRLRAQALFLQSQASLDVAVGTLNTIVLLTSSWVAANAVLSARKGDLLKARWLIVSAEALGVLFIVLKLYEWAKQLAVQHTFTSNEFFSFYFFLTGMHLLHVFLGIGIFTYAHLKLRTPTETSAELVETSTTYWHMVDLLWVFIFALLYMMK